MTCEVNGDCAPPPMLPFLFCVDVLQACIVPQYRSMPAESSDVLLVTPTWTVWNWTCTIYAVAVQSQLLNCSQCM